MSLTNQISLTLIVSFFFFSLKSQVKFDDYKTLKSQGEIPKDFLVASSQKVDSDFNTNNQDMSRRNHKKYLEIIHYGVDELLQSGLVVFNDEVSNYVADIATKLLKGKPELRNKLRFYTVKSNESNAFSTDQGIIFVTTGLISQLINEAQLAFILSHEIAHYEEEHVIESFKLETNAEGLSETIKQLSIYSHEIEFEADEKALKYYNEAGYGQEYVSSVFDLLLYSYLPIDEIPFKLDYFNSSLSYLPDGIFPLTKYEIKASEDQDDTKSSHPNVKKRKEKTTLAVANYPNWGTEMNLLGQERFNYIRNISRFERVRLDVINADFGDALYTVYILEEEFPQSIYLARLKGHCWTGMMAHKLSEHERALKNNEKYWEGEGASLYHFLSKLPSIELGTLGMRVLEDTRKVYPTDLEIKTLWTKMSELFFQTETMSIKNFHALTYHQAYDEFVLDSQSLSTDDSSEVQATKYERINAKRNNTVSGDFDSSLYYLYNLSDLIQDKAFISVMERLEEDKSAEKIKEEAKLALSKKQRAKIEKKNKRQEGRIELNKIILFEPDAISLKKKKVNLEKSDKLAITFTKSINAAAKELGIEVANVGKMDYNEHAVELFNEKGILTSLLIQVIRNEGVGLIPVDFSSMNLITERYQTNKIAYTVVEHSFDWNASLLLVGIICPPSLPFTFFTPLFEANNTNIELYIFNMDDGKLEASKSYYVSTPTYRMALQTNFYDILQDIKL
jgi:hypothetical protein